MITKETWRKYIQMLAEIDDKAADEMRAWIEENGLNDNDAVIQRAYALATKYGETSAALSCEMYEYMADLMDADVPEAVPAETATYREVAQGTMWGKYHSPSQIPAVVGRQVRQAGADTMIQNAKRDNAEWAWVPQGDTCAFCIMLASRGWQDASKTVLKGNHAEHVHQNCDCTFAIAFKESDKRQYDGIYDESKYYNMYYDAMEEEGGDWRDAVNHIRRGQYAKDPTKYREQKRNDNNVLKNSEKQRDRGILNIEIDELVPCLRETKTGNLVDTEVFRIQDIKDLRLYNEANGWNVNWSKLAKGNDIYCVRVKGDEEIQGLIAFHYDNDAKGMYLAWASSAPWNVKQHTGGTQRYTGVGGHLFAIAAEKTLEIDSQGGWMYGFAMNKKLIEYYKEYFGAKHLPVQHPNQIVIDTPDLYKLLKTYNYEWKK